MKNNRILRKRIFGLLLAAAVFVTSPGGMSVFAAAPAEEQPAADQAAGGQSDAAGDQKAGDAQPAGGDQAGNENAGPAEQPGTENGAQAGENGGTSGNPDGTAGAGTNGSQGGGAAGSGTGGSQNSGTATGGSGTDGSQNSGSDTSGGQSGTAGSAGAENAGNSSGTAGGNENQPGGNQGGGASAGVNGEVSVPGSSTDQNQSSKVVEGEVIVDKNNDKVEVGKNDKPYLALGADLNEQQRATVLGIMGIDPASLGNYDVVYVTNQEEHQYLDSYISSSQIGSKSLSSVLIIERKKGSGLNISTNNITYCTVGMYKNALVTAGITDADIIVAGPTGISGTAALVGVFKAYQEMTGQVIDAEVIDVALHELVVTGELEASIDGLTDEEVEEFIAYIKSVIAENDLSDEESINRVIDEACEKYGVVLSDEERQQIVDLLLKLTSLGIDLNGLVDYAHSLYNNYKSGGGSGILSAIGDFFSNIFTAIGDFFKGLFS